MRTPRSTREVTIRIPNDLADQLDQVLAQQIARAASAGRVGRSLPTRHGLLLAAVRDLLAAEQAKAA